MFPTKGRGLNQFGDSFTVALQKIMGHELELGHQADFRLKNRQPFSGLPVFDEQHSTLVGGVKWPRYYSKIEERMSIIICNLGNHLQSRWSTNPAQESPGQVTITCGRGLAAAGLTPVAGLEHNPAETMVWEV
jgi:hypothetical protein